MKEKMSMASTNFKFRKQMLRQPGMYNLQDGVQVAECGSLKTSQVFTLFDFIFSAIFVSCNKIIFKYHTMS